MGCEIEEFLRPTQHYCCSNECRKKGKIIIMTVIVNVKLITAEILDFVTFYINARVL